LTKKGIYHVTNTAKEDCQALLDVVLPFARQMLSRHKAFFPFGAAVQPDGQIVSVGTSDGNEKPAAGEIAKLLKGAFVAAAQAGDYKATALATDILYGTNKTDAISVELDHQDDYSIKVIIPYKIVKGKLVEEPISAEMGRKEIFVAS